MVKSNRPDIFVYDKKAREIILIKVGIPSQDNLQSVQNEKKRKYDLLTNEIRLPYKAKTKAIAYLITLEDMVTQYNRSKIKELGVTPFIKT